MGISPCTVLPAGPHPSSRSKVDTEIVVMGQTTEERVGWKHRGANGSIKSNGNQREGQGERASVRWFLDSSGQDIVKGTKNNSPRKS